jgi:4-aminobutyrate aminotransferase/(S)-3-amino-2-methylpropionate transaminase
MKRRNAAVVQAAYHATPVFVAKAEGGVVEDVDGNRLIDFAGGIGCLNTGHRAPAVVDAVRRQLDRFLHTSFNVLPYESYIAVCEKLNALVPGKGPKKTILVNTGAEAVENAIKIARRYTKRQAIISFEDAFHGRTWRWRRPVRHIRIKRDSSRSRARCTGFRMRIASAALTR